MQITHIDLLKIQCDLLNIPRGMTRFQEYVNTIIGDTDDILYLPLAFMNPMGREHVAARLNELFAIDAEQIARNAARDAEQRLSHLNEHYQHGIVLIDDVLGGWTNRYTTEASLYFNIKAGIKRHWITTSLWVSDPPSSTHIYQQVLCAIYRTLHAQQHGTPKTLRQMMHQEGQAAAFAHLTPHLDAEELDYSRDVITPYLDTDNYAICFAAMYGDEAAHVLGYEPLGLSPRAGFAVGLADANDNELVGFTESL